MLKGKNSLLTKISALLLVIVVTLSTVPTEFLGVKAAGSEMGVVTLIDEVGGEIDSSNPNTVQIKYGGEIVIAHLGVDAEKGREKEGWYVGALMSVPDGMTDFSNAKYVNAAGEEVPLVPGQESIYMWQQVDEREFQAQSINGGELSYTWTFQWNNETLQKVVFTIDTSSVTLSEDTVAPVMSKPVVNPNTWTNGNVEIKGTVSDSFSGVKAVYYKKQGTTEEQTATLEGETYSFTVNAETYEGKYIVWCEDNAGNRSENVEVDVYMDNTAPEITAKADTTDWTKNDVVISGTATDAKSGIKAVYYQKGSEGTKAEIEEFNVSNGTFKATIPTQEYQGEYIVSCIDNAGNEAQTTVSVKMDNKVPEIKDVKANITTWTNQPVIISGTVEDTTSGVEAIYYKKGQDGESVSIENKGGKFELEIEPQEYDGVYSVYCRDMAGNISNMEVAVKMDNENCIVSTGVASCQEWTNENITINGSVFDKTSGVASVSWKKGDGSAKGEATFNAYENTYSFDVQAQNYNGNYIITCKDKAGNTSSEFEVPVKMDKTAPVVSEATASETKWTKEAVIIEGTVSDDRSGVVSVTYKKADGTEEKEAALKSDNTYSITLDPDDYDGAYTIYCTDAAGNKSEGYNVNVKMDKKAPTVETPTVSAQTWTNGSVKITGTVSDELSQVGSVICVKTGTTEKEMVNYVASTGNYEINLEAQTYCGAYTIIFTDKAGNAVSAEVAVQMDIVQPELSNIEPIYKDGDWVNTGVNITGKAEDLNAGVAGVYYKKGGETDEQAKEARVENGKFTINIGTQSYAGTYVIYCIDNAGNRSADSVISVYMDNKQCKILSAEVTPSDWTNKDVVICGHVWDNLSGIEKVTYKQENAEKEESIAVNPVEGEEDFTFSYSITIPKQSYDGNYILTCKDKAGNEMLEAKMVAVKMDITAPKVVEAKADPSDWCNGVVKISGRVNDSIENGAQSGVVSYTYKKAGEEETEPIKIEADGTFSFTLDPDDYEGIYTIYCTDAAGNKSDGYDVKVKMDNIAPNGTTIECGDSVWKKIVDKLTFKLFFNNEQTFIVSTNDNRSGIKTIEYIEKDVKGIEKLTKDDVKNAEGWKAIYNGKEKETESEASVKIASTPDKNVVVCVRVTDFAGNVAYVTTDGLIFDTTNPAGALTDNRMVLPKEAAAHTVPGTEKPLYGTADVKTADDKQVIPFDVKITEATSEGVLQSGIQKVTYKVESKDREGDEYQATQGVGSNPENPEEGTLYEWNQTDALLTEFTDVINVDAELNNYNYVKVTVDVIDNAGNTSSETYEFAIDITAPTIKIGYDNNGFVGSEGQGHRGYFATERTLTVTYTERKENWNQGRANEVLEDTVAVDAKGEKVAYSIEWEPDEEGTSSDEDVHIAKVKFTNEAHYNVATPSFTDAAGNKNEEVTEESDTKYPYVFSIDKYDENTDSTATIELMKQSWINKFLDAITFGRLFTNAEQNVKVTVGDDLAGIKEVKYIEKDMKDIIEAQSKDSENITRNITIAEDEVRAYGEWENATVIDNKNDKELAGEVTKTIQNTENKNIVVFVNVIDYAGHDRIFSSDGVIVDIADPAGALTGNKMVLPKEAAAHTVPGTERPLYGTTDVKTADGKQVIPFDVKITEATSEGVLQSGIQKVTYKVESKDRAENKYQVTQGVGSNPENLEEGTLYEWNQTDALLTEFTDVINVDAELNNYNYVKVTVDVIDNAGNTSSETYEFAIDITAPTIKIGYDNNGFVGSEGQDQRGYFDENRTLTVTYTERSENWDKKAANDVLADTVAVDAKGEKVAYSIEWEPDEEGTNSDKDVHIAKVKFTNEAHYNVATPSFTDAAGNKNEEVTEESDTKYPYIFSIDKYDKDTDSTATIELMEESWINEFLYAITFGRLFTNAEQNVKVTVGDDLAGIREVKYIEKDMKDIIEAQSKDSENLTRNITIAEDEVRAYGEWENATVIDNKNDKELAGEVTKTIQNTEYKNVVVFVNVIDYAGHDRLFSSDGVVVDITKPTPALEGNKLVLPEVAAKNKVPSSKRPLYGSIEVGEAKEVVFDVKVTEATVEGVLQSGIQSVTYEIKAKDRATDKKYVELEPGKDREEGTLYSWKGYEKEPLKTVYDSTAEKNADAKIVVNAEKFNYNYVDLTVKVVDNAGNETTETYEFAIDIEKPTVSIEYKNNTFVTEDEEQGYFNKERIATITYTERSENWDKEVAEKELITAKNIREEGLPPKEKAYSIEWNDIEGTNSDEDTHVAKITFTTTSYDEDGEKVGQDARYDIDTSYTDAAGNSASKTEVSKETLHPFKFTIDTVSPESVAIGYNKPVFDTVIDALTFNYYDSQVEVTVTVKDETSKIIQLDYEGLLDSNVSAKNKEVLKTALDNAVIEQDETSKDTFVARFKIPQSVLTEFNSFRGTVKVKAYDCCYNSTEKHDSTRLVVDKIAPKAQVTFSAPVKEANGVSYYNGDFTATIVIDEANFYAEDVNVLVNNARVYPTDWTQNGDVWTSHVTFTGDNDYVLKVNYTDRSGNVMTPYESNQKTLDTTDPVIAVSNLKHESANNSETIGFVLTITDKNIVLADIKPQVTAVVRKGNNSSNYTYETVSVDLGTPSVSTNANGETVYTYTVENLQVDGYYSITCAVADLANHTVSNLSVSGNDGRSSVVETMNFSVNREGSVFWIETEHTDKYTNKTMKNELDGAYANDQVIVRLHEVNVDKVDDLDADDKRTVFTLNDGNESNTVELVENYNGSGNYERNVEIGQGGWYKTTYTLDNEQFQKDGTYSLNIITYDKAENSNVNAKSEEGTIRFVVDRTNPVITSNVKNEQSIKENGYTVEFKIADVNLDPATVAVKLNGQQTECEEVSTGTYQFKVDEAQWKNFPQLSQDFVIVAKDLAGNSAEVYERGKITVTDDVFIQAAAYMINHPLMLGLSATGIVALVGLFIILIILKRRKEQEE